jgi:hypothetical protein
MKLLQQLLELDPKLAYHDTLNPKLWEQVDGTYVLKADVADALKRIAATFAKTLGVDQQYITDIILTGSNANFNWTNLSDIDIHLEVDLDNLKCDDCRLDVEGCMQAKKSLWNLSHDVTVYGHDVEVYVCDNKEDLVGSAAAYSLLNNAWLQEPKPDDKRAAAAYTADMIRVKADQLAHEIDQAIKTHADDEDTLKELNDKLSKMRAAGLATGGEFSLENQVFKALRNNGYVQKLRKQIVTATDKSLSLEEALDTKVDYEVIKISTDVFSARAEIGDRMIVFTAESYESVEPGTWEVDFSERPTLKTKVIKLGQKYAKTDSGEEFKVFSFVLAAMREFAERYAPEKIIFTSAKSDENRTSLYARMLKKFKLPGYEAAEVRNIGQADQFEIVRKG